jgi:serine phosphatase RsbU (regulator of sigma subunit)/anti-sigma regulatory factor (Ser/Thr protein kinase)
MNRQILPLHSRGRAALGRALRVMWVRQSAIDLLLALTVAVAVGIAIGVAEGPGARQPTLLAYAYAACIGALVLGRRRWPVGVLLASHITLQAYYFSNFPGIWPAVALAVAMYSVAAAGRIWWALGIAVWYLVVPLAMVALGVLGPLDMVLDGIVRDGALLIAVMLFGSAMRAHRASLAEAADRVRRAEEDQRREAQELSAARLIQQQMLPKALPSLPGWRVAARYQPARAVGGDFYDLLHLPDGRVLLVAGDVTDKGIPAALVMATTSSMLRGDAPDLVSPGAVLGRANERLYAEIPAHMFVTCLVALLDPRSGRLRYANAGHCLPLLKTADGVGELWATGMPLGAMPGMAYDEHETDLAPGDSLLLYSDGLVEAHNPAGDMFGFSRLQKVVERSNGSPDLIDACLAELQAFVGTGWEQEDDITLVVLQRCAVWRTLADFSVPSAPGNERQAIAEVTAAVQGIGLSRRQLERLQTAVAEATMNAMEHGNHYAPELPVRIRVSVLDQQLSVAVTDGGSGAIRSSAEAPALAARLAGQQPPRGWGMLLIEHMVDELRVSGEDNQHTVELMMRLGGRTEEGEHASGTM